MAFGASHLHAGVIVKQLRRAGSESSGNGSSMPASGRIVVELQATASNSESSSSGSSSGKSQLEADLVLWTAGLSPSTKSREVSRVALPL